MNIDFDEDQREIAATAAAFLRQRLPLDRLRELSDAESESVVDEATWREYAAMGWLSLGLPERLGGVGVGATAEAALFIELGRGLAPGPVLPTVIAGWVCASAGESELAQQLADGSVRAGLTLGELVLDGAAGQLAVTFQDNRCELREISQLERVTSIDKSVRTHRASRGGVVAVADDPLLLARAQLLVAAMELGIATAVRDMSVEYAKTRRQFGVPIGTFQAVKHRCSDMTIRAYAAEGQLMYALWQLERRADGAAFHAAATRLVSTRASVLNCSDNVQNHGAIGFTEEHDAGFYSRRAHVLEFVLGGHEEPAATVLAEERHRFEPSPPAPDDWWAAAAASVSEGTR